MREILVVLSGEHPTLPPSEVAGILEAEGITIGDVRREGRLLSVEVVDPERAASAIAERAAFSKKVAVLLGDVPLPAEQEDLLLEIGKVRLPDIRGSFRVRTYKISNRSPLRSAEIERLIGREILNRIKHLKVDLSNPDHEIMAILTNDRLLLAVLMRSVDRASIRARAVSMRPFRHPSSMDPFLARAMLNLARVRPGSAVLDPFVGAGGIALEAVLLGARLVGFDIDPEMVRGAERNLSSYSIFSGYELAAANIRDLRLNLRFDAVVTDPPYGRCSKAVGGSPLDLISVLLDKSRELLRPGGYIVFSAPREMRPSKLTSEMGFSVREVHSLRVHKGLTREIVVGVNPS